MKTKTTFELDSQLLKQLKATAARAGKSVRDLLTEGATTVLAKYDALEDRDVLERRGQEARQRMRGGYFNGAADLSANIDRIVYVAADGPLEYGQPAKKPKAKRR